MNAGTDYGKAKRQAQANADQSGVTWRMFLYSGIWWIERRPTWPGVTDPDGAEIIKPTVKETSQP